MPIEIISYLEMCQRENSSLQKGMNFRLGGNISVILMSRRENAPYTDEVSENGNSIIYEGHNVPKSKQHPEPFAIDQQIENSAGGITENGKFFKAAKHHYNSREDAEQVRVYEKIRPGVWSYNGLFELSNAWEAQSNGRRVYKFLLDAAEEPSTDSPAPGRMPVVPRRIIPASIKLAVWQRDDGKCVMCSATKNLHFDHIIPYSKGGSSTTVDNVQILCSSHNLAKHDKIE